MFECISTLSINLISRFTRYLHSDKYYEFHLRFDREYRDAIFEFVCVMQNWHYFRHSIVIYNKL